MFTDPENYNRDTQRESERDFLPFEESFNKNQNKIYLGNNREKGIYD